MVPLPRPLVACYGPDMAPRRAVELRVGGQTYRVVAGDDDQHVQRLADLVDRKHAAVVPQGGRGVTAQQAIFLTALALAEELEEQRSRAARLEVERDRSSHLAARAREAVLRLLQRVDNALSPMAPACATASPAMEEPTAPRAAPPQPALPVSRPAPPPALARTSDPMETVQDSVLLEILPLSTHAEDEGASVPRSPRGPLRLVRQSTSSDDDSR